ncbi:DEAD-box ATP-dependent RNA helicase 47, mitochondrial [Dorcoceras hygrometricum]|uniref:DEAD-box ATP-dependent RNA helicase 47, mitochondrial n=1 Tax=Dorcoceras hygrometricum TaxID=472368 RepID=A0A2Z7BX78_9LAMI|nr:DEAD-box ATP-dependent RNA helicase 47, mitochondrial [Dorcoceras hygrometricum]
MMSHPLRATGRLTSVDNQQAYNLRDNTHRLTTVKSTSSTQRSTVMLTSTYLLSAGPSAITAQWSPGTTNQPATTPIIAFDPSGATTQPADQNASSTQSTIQLSTKLKMGRNHLPRAAKEQKNYWPTIAKIFELCNYFALLNPVNQVSKLVSIERAKKDKLSASNLAPNNGGNRWQANGKEFG